MKTADCDILIVPGLGGSEEGHWQARWAGRLGTARLVEQDQWHAPTPEAWCGRIAEAVAAATRPVILIAHSLGVVACVEAVPRFPAGARARRPVGGRPGRGGGAGPAGFGARLRADPAGPPALPVAAGRQPDGSRIAATTRADDFAHAWGALTVDAGEAGHINVASGHGPWPEGLMRLAGFLKGL